MGARGSGGVKHPNEAVQLNFEKKFLNSTSFGLHKKNPKLCNVPFSILAANVPVLHRAIPSLSRQRLVTHIVAHQLAGQKECH